MVVSNSNRYEQSRMALKIKASSGFAALGTHEIVVKLSRKVGLRSLNPDVLKK